MPSANAGGPTVRNTGLSDANVMASSLMFLVGYIEYWALSESFNTMPNSSTWNFRLFIMMATLDNSGWMDIA